ncbi:uncharacterized protein LOC111056702 [Nilaparvata lugens]|uniref:uncharacterized protein LOC111056702 n=1 Tax=Nilaparvata lugens TaxID=108931 RepID=UPI00193CB8C4|nr:uncharacterized protein LOC111056702 [Nilaparvata lugens]
MLWPVNLIFSLHFTFCYFLCFGVLICFAQRVNNHELQQTGSNQIAPKFRSHKFVQSVNSKPMSSNKKFLPNNKEMAAFSANQRVGVTHDKKETVTPVTSFPLKDSCFSSPMIIILPQQTKEKCYENPTTQFPFSRCPQAQETQPPKPAEFRNRMPMECIPNNFGAVCPCGEQTEISILKSITSGKPKPQVYSCKWEGKLIQAPEILSGFIQ